MQEEVKQLIEEAFTRERHFLGSMLWILPNPDPVLRKKGIALSTYKELLADSRVGGAVRSRKSGVLKLEWQITGESRRARKEISECFKRLKLNKVISQMLDAVFFGYKPCEVIWERNKYILPKEIRGLPPEWFVFDSENRIRFLSKQSTYPGEEVPEKKLLLLQHEADYENPYGKPLLSEVFWPVTFKRGGIKFWIMFIEKYGIPYLIGKVPPGTSEEKKQELLNDLSSMVMDAVAVIEDTSSIDTLNTAGKSSSTNLYSTLIRVMNEEIAISILGQNLTTSVQGGSYAAAKVHQDVREDLIISDKNMIKEAMNTLIRWICELNFTGEPPQFEFVEEDDPKQEWAERDRILSEQIQFTKKYYMKRYNLEEDDFELRQTPSIQGFKEFSEPKFTPEQEQIESLIEDALKKLNLKENTEKIKKLIQDAKSYDEIQIGLAELFPQLSLSQFEELLSQCLVAAELWGRYTAKKKL